MLNYNFKGIKNNATITILNSNGIVVKRFKSYTGETGQINISNLAAGVYVLQAEDGIKKQTIQFIKQ